ncbi:MAG: tetratricopeptide repeat protein [Leptolyngbya sp. BL-A-14]
MSLNHRHPTFKQRRDRPNQTSFIGRDAQLQAFRSALNTPCAERNQFIFNLSGQGGIGKTTLLKQFRKIAEEAKQAVAYVDEGAESNRVDNVPEVLDRLAADLEKQGHKFDALRERYRVYRQKRQELETDPDAPQGFVAGLGRVVAKASLGAAKSIPGSGAVLDFVDTNAMADKTGEFAAFVARKLTNKDDVQLVNEPIEVLTPLFLADFNRLADKQTVVLLLDTYEQTGTFLDDWVRSLLDGRYGDLSANFLLAIAGRDPLNRNDWDALEDWMVRSELEPFTEEEAQQYLTSKGITHEAVIQEIWRLSSGGLPLLIGMMAQAAPNSPDAITDPCEDAVERFLKWETDSAKRQIAMKAALPRVLNQDVLAQLEAETNKRTLFDWLKSRSFVIEHPEGWQYHSVVREQMLRYQRKLSTQEWADLHGKLATYYDQLRQQSGLATDAAATSQPVAAERLTDAQRQRLTTQQAGLQADWDLKTEKLKQLRHDLAIATDTATKFKLQHDIDAEETQLAQLTTQLDDIEQTLDHDQATPAASASSEANQWWAAPKEQWKDEIWQKYTLEWLYHSLCAAPQGQLGMALNGWLAALKQSQQLAQEWANVMVTAGEVTACAALKGWGERLRNGLQAYQDDNYRVAIDLFSAVLKVPQLGKVWRPVALNWRGSIYLQVEQYEQSLQDLTEAISLAPKEAKYWLDRGRAYRLARRYEDALADFKHAIEIDADNKWAMSYRGATYLLMMRYEDALADFNRVISLDANSVWGITLRGLTYLLTTRYEDALTEFKHAVEIDANDPCAIASRGMTYRLMMRYEDALTDLKRAIEIDASKDWVIVIRDEIHRLVTRDEKLNCDLIANKAWWANVNYGHTNRESKQYTIRDFNPAIEFGSDSSWNLRGRRAAYLLNGQPDTALQALTQASSPDPKDDWFPYIRALAYLKLNQLQPVQTDLATAIQLAQTKYEQSPTDWQNTFNLALYHLAADHTETADALYHQSLTAPAEWLRMGIDDLQDFLTLFPNHAQAQQMVTLLQSTLEGYGV